MKVLALNAPYFDKFSRPQRSPAVTKSGTLYFPIWMSFCVGVLEQDGCEVDFVDAPAWGLKLDDVLERARAFAPDLIVMDTTTPSVDNDILVASKLKMLLPSCVIMFVGTHVSALPEQTLEQAAKIGDSVDLTAFREYEYTVRDVARAVRDAGGMPPVDVLRSIPGLALTHDGIAERTMDRTFIENLDELPWVSKVYKKHLNIRHYFNPNARYPMVTLITSRGCPFRCSFCVYPQTLSGRRYRFRSVNDVVEEMAWVHDHFPEARSVFFEDDTLTADKKRCQEFSRAIIDRGLRMDWTANSRIDLDYETMVLMRKAGCRHLCVGFESGDPEALKSMHKGIKRERMLEFMADARRAGILIHGCFIFGFPGDTRESIQRTIDFAIELGPDTVQFYPVMVYPGTEAYEDYKQRGWITVGDFSRWLTPDGLHNCVVRNENLSGEELVRLCDLARRRFYLRPRYLIYKLRQVLLHPKDWGRTAKAARTFFKHLLLGSRV